jgi:acyl-coenzyme A thioesterase PaaI-like protein
VDDASLQAEGWSLMPGAPFTEYLGKFWWRFDDVGMEAGFIGLPTHANHIDRVSGGMLATFADVALGGAVVRALQDPLCATIQLNMHYVSTARIGELVTCRPDVVRKTSDLVFVRGVMQAAGRTIASADGIWKLLKPQT